MQLEVTNVFDCPIVCTSGVHAWENGIKIDSLTSQDIVPLGIRELRDLFWPKHHVFGCLDIKCMILDKFSGELLAHGKDCIARFIIDEPDEKWFVWGMLFGRSSAARRLWVGMAFLRSLNLVFSITIFNISWSVTMCSCTTSSAIVLIEHGDVGRNCCIIPVILHNVHA